MQTVFLIDLPRLDEVVGEQGNDEEVKKQLTFFGKELLYFLEAMGLDRDVIKGVLKFDFAATQGLAFVHSMSVSHFPRQPATYSRFGSWAS